MPDKFAIEEDPNRGTCEELGGNGDFTVETAT